MSLAAPSYSYYSITTVGAQSLNLLLSCGKKNIPCGVPSCSVGYTLQLAAHYANIVALWWCAMRVRNSTQVAEFYHSSISAAMFTVAIYDMVEQMIVSAATGKDSEERFGGGGEEVSCQ